MSGQAHGAQVRHDDGVVLDEHRREGCPHIAGVTETVQQDDGRPFSSDANVKTGSIGRHHLHTKAWRIGFDSGEGAHADGDQRGNGND